jgi:hypothetical protein
MQGSDFSDVDLNSFRNRSIEATVDFSFNGVVADRTFEIGEEMRDLPTDGCRSWIK